MGKLPFEVTPQIKRYLEDILFLDKEYLFGGKEGGDLREILCLIERQKSNELNTPKQRYNEHHFWKYLAEQNAICRFFSGKKAVDVKFSNIRKEQLTKRGGVIAIGKNMESPYKINYITAKNNWQQNLINVVDKNSSKYEPFQMLDIKPVEELLERIKTEEGLQKTNEIIETKNYRKSSKVEFDRQNVVLWYKNKSHKFRKGIMGDPMKLKLFKQLWDNRFHKRKEKEIATGSAIDPAVLAVNIGFTQERWMFERNKKTRDDFSQKLKDIKKPLKKKGFPVEIEVKNGVQLVIIEK